MAISMGAALLGSAVIGAGANAIGASANSKAIGKATDAQVQSNRESLELQKDIYGKNNALLSPFVERGNVAGDTINALLGLPTATGNGPGMGEPDYAGYVQGNPDLLAEYQRNPMQWGSLENYGKFHWDTYGQGEGRQLSNSSTSITSGVTPVTAQGAFDGYRQSAGYNFLLGEANKAADTQFAANGALDSGAAVKAAQDRSFNLGSQFFNNYLGLLGNQQGVGLSGASAVAGVGQNYANNATAINSNTAQAIGQGAIAKANNTNDLLSGLSSSFGLAAGGMTKFGK